MLDHFSTDFKERVGLQTRIPLGFKCYWLMDYFSVKSVLSGRLYYERGKYAQFEVYRTDSFEDFLISQSMVNRLYIYI